MEYPPYRLDLSPCGGHRLITELYYLSAGKCVMKLGEYGFCTFVSFGSL